MSNRIDNRGPVSSILKKRADSTKAMLEETSPTIFQQQKHLNEGSAERAYWHYGYLSALKDTLKLMSESN